MQVCCVFYIKYLWVFFMCFTLLCLIISESKVHADTTGIVLNKTDADSKTAVVKLEKSTVSENQSKDLSHNGKNKSHETQKTVPSANITTHTNVPNVTKSSVYSPVGSKEDYSKNIGSGAVARGFSVFVGLGAIVVMYIIVRTIRLRRKKTTVRKYGILANREDVEMTPLGADDEEEDTTLFDMSSQKSRP